VGFRDNPSLLLTDEEAVRLKATVGEAESRTSAEIKVAVVRHCWGRLEEKAAALFRKRGLDCTDERNCVLIMLVVANREFIVHGDEGIHAKVGQAFWDELRDVMQARFPAGEFCTGLCEAVTLAGEKLAAHFPRRADDRNEVSDDVATED
jgi:uncharacterized membrane protein